MNEPIVAKKLTMGSGSVTFGRLVAPKSEVGSSNPVIGGDTYLLKRSN